MEAVTFGSGLPGFEAGDKSSPAAIIVLQEWWGVNHIIKEQAQMIADATGYRYRPCASRAECVYQPCRPSPTTAAAPGLLTPPPAMQFTWQGAHPRPVQGQDWR
jgi:hypothetical protein